MINFGILYGMSVKGLADAADMGFYEAKDFIENYFELRKPIKEYLDNLIKKAKERDMLRLCMEGEGQLQMFCRVILLFGQRRSERRKICQYKGREADLMKRAMILVDKELRKVDSARMVMQVHDSLMVECDIQDAEEVGKF